jgi:hypothetical protein
VSFPKSPAVADSTLSQFRLFLHGLLQTLKYQVTIIHSFVISTAQFPERSQQAVAQVECLEAHPMRVTCLSNAWKISSKMQMITDLKRYLSKYCEQER